VNAGRSAPARLPWRAARRLRGTGGGVRGQLVHGATVLARPRREPGGADLWRALLADMSTSPEAPRRAGRRRRRGLGALASLGRQDAPQGRFQWHLDHPVRPSRADFL